MKNYLRECLERAKECVVLLPFIILPLLCMMVSGKTEKEMSPTVMTTTTISLPAVEDVEQEEEDRFLYVRGTVYNPTKEQCGDNPGVTADGKEINHEHLESGKLRWCAVSKDLLKHVSYGDKIYVHHSDKRIAGIWEVHDLCGIRNTVDFLRPWPDTLGLWRNLKIEILKED